MSQPIRVEIDEPERPRSPGERLRGRVHLRSSSGEDPHAVLLTQYWRTHGRGDRNVEVVGEATLHEGYLRPGEAHVFDFEVTVPPGPFTYHGELLDVDHYLEAELRAPWGTVDSDGVLLTVEPGPVVPTPPHLERERETEVMKEKGSGCGSLVGLALVVVGFLTLPGGLVLVAVGALILLPRVRSVIASGKVGDVEVTVHPEVVAPGETTVVRVALDPKNEVTLRRVAATIRCREIVHAGTGSDRKRHEKALWTDEVVLRSGPTTLPGGEVTVIEAPVRIPEAAVFSFSGPDNAVVWQADVKVDIPAWPDWTGTDLFVVWPSKVLPASARRRGVRASARREERPVREPAPVEVRPSPEPQRPAPEPPPPEERPAPRPPPEAPDSSRAPGAADPPRAPSPPDPGDGRDAVEPEIARRVRAVAAEPRIGGSRQDRIRELVGGDYTFALVVRENRQSFGVPVGYRGGRTLVGTVADTDVSVEVRLPPSRNAETRGLSRGDRIRVSGTVVEWQKLDGRPLVEA